MRRSNSLTGTPRNRSNNQSKQTDMFDTNTERQAKRLSRQQKKLEKTTGISNITDIKNPYAQRVIKLQDVKQIQPLTDTQSDFFRSWDNQDADGYVLYGSAGTGKTFIAMYHALVEILSPESIYEKIIIVRSSVQSRDMGHLPGSIEEKMEAFEAPYDGILYDLTQKKGAYAKLKDMGKIEFCSTAFLRGTTFSNCIVIVDENQDMSWMELATVTTRLGRDAKIIFCGDSKQNDLHYKKTDTSGFDQFIEVSRKMPEFRNFRFTTDDIVRSDFVRSFLIVCESLGF